MQISSEMFRSIVRSVRADPDDRGLRKAGRVGVSGRAVIVPMDRPETVPVIVKVRDVSPKGIGILFDRPMNVGARFLLRLTRDSGGADETILCHVMRWSPVAADLFNIGATFADAIGAPNKELVEAFAIIDELYNKLDSGSRKQTN